MFEYREKLLTDGSAVWDVFGVIDGVHIELNCIDRSHAERLKETLNDCVEDASAYYPGGQA